MNSFGLSTVVQFLIYGWQSRSGRSGQWFKFISAVSICKYLQCCLIFVKAFTHLIFSCVAVLTLFFLNAQSPYLPVPMLCIWKWICCNNYEATLGFQSVEHNKSGQLDLVQLGESVIRKWPSCRYRPLYSLNAHFRSFSIAFNERHSLE